MVQFLSCVSNNAAIFLFRLTKSSSVGLNRYVLLRLIRARRISHLEDGKRVALSRLVARSHQSKGTQVKSLSASASGPTDEDPQKSASASGPSDKDTQKRTRVALSRLVVRPPSLKAPR